MKLVWLAILILAILWLSSIFSLFGLAVTLLLAWLVVTAVRKVLE